MQAMKHVGQEPFPTIYVDPKPDSEAAKSGAKYEPIAKAQQKKMTKLWQQEVTLGQTANFIRQRSGESPRFVFPLDQHWFLVLLWFRDGSEIMVGAASYRL